MSDLPSGTVTFLFSDIEESARAWDRAEDEMAAALARHDELLTAAIEGNQGTLVKSTGDGVMAVFGDAARAVEAAVSAQQAVAEEAWPTPEPLRVRMGIHTGTAEERDGDYFGVTPTRAARIMGAAHGGQILVSAATAGLLATDIDLVDLGEHPLKGLEQPEHVHQLVAPGLREDFPPLRTARLARHNLPPERNRFVGRDEELVAVQKALGERRITTLTGVGGCGKTRLAVEVARRETERFPDGVFLVDLTTVSDEELIPGAALSALSAPSNVTSGRSPRQGLLAYLAHQHLLLLLDNCEHLVEGCADLVDHIIDTCPDVKVLATSREALEVAGEQTYRVPSLGIPEDDGTPLASDAVRLFVERAAAVRPDFEVTDESRDAVVEICRRLDGIPLAIELAAARVSHLSPPEIAARLDDRFRLLTGRRRRIQRQQTLEATLDWSWDLLDDDERTLLRRLAVFPGRFGIEAVEGIGGFDADTVDLMGSLVGKSLVMTTDDHGVPGYRMLESVRLYAQQRLVEAGEAAEFRGRHCTWFAAWAETLMGPSRVGATSMVRAVVPEFDNVRAAIEWAIAEGRIDEAASLFSIAAARASFPGLGDGGSAEEEGEWAAALIERRDQLPNLRAAEIVARAALLSMWQARFDEMRDRAELAIELAGSEISGFVPMAFTLRGLRVVFEDPEGAADDMDRAIELASRPDQSEIRSSSVVIRAGVDLITGDVESAIATYQSVLGTDAERDPDFSARMAWSELSLAYLASGRADAAERVLELAERRVVAAWEATTVDLGVAAALIAEIRADGTGNPPPRLLEMTRDELRFDIPLGHLVALDAWVELEIARGDFERAAEILGSQRSVALQNGWRSPAQLPLYRAQVARVRAHLDEETARAARDRGGQWTPDEILRQELERAEIS